MSNDFKVVRQTHGPRNYTPLNKISVTMDGRTDAGVAALSIDCRPGKGVLLSVVMGKHKLIPMERLAACIADLIDRPDAEETAPDVVTSHDADELYAARLRAAEHRYRSSNETNYHTVFDEEMPWEVEHRPEGPALYRKVYLRPRGAATTHLSIFRVSFKAGSSAIISARFI